MSTNIVIPTLGESITEGVIATWLKGEGDFVDRDEPILELETDKITMEVPAPVAGVVHPSVSEGETVTVGAVVGSVDESDTSGASNGAAGASAPATEAPPAESHAAAPEAPGDQAVRSTPLAKKVAEEHGVPLDKIKGTGAGGRIREQDVLDFVGGGAAAPTAEASAPTAAPAVSGGRGVTREKMTPLRQRVAARLVEAQQTAAMLTTFNECDMTNVMQLRARHKESFEKKHGVKLGFMSFFVKAAVNALQSFPRVNAYIVDGAEGPEIEHHEYCDIAVAVGTPKGLVVPVVRNSESLSFAGVEKGINELAARARDGKLGLEDMQGGTFTISNGGVYGSMMSTPILNPPQSGILGMHNIVRRPVESPDAPGSGEMEVRPMMYLALSYDHRMVDGAEAVGFLKTIKECIEDPERLLLDL